MSMLIKIMNNFKNQRVPSLMININNKKYLINAPELIQRFLRENGVKLGTNSKNEWQTASSEGIKIFITGNTNEYIGGLMGLMCSLNDKNFAEGTKIYCPNNIFSFLMDNKYVFGMSFLLYSVLSVGSPYGLSNYTYGFTSRNNMSFGNNRKSMLKTYFEWNAFCENMDKENFTNLNNALSTIAQKSDYFTQEELKKFNIEIIQDEGCEIVIIKHYNKDASAYVLNYMFITPPSKNKLDKVKLANSGLKGKEVGDLMKNGFVVKDGVKITLDDVKHPDEKGVTVLILDLQDESFIASFKQNTLWAHVQQDNVPFDFAYVIHCHGKRVLEYESGTYLSQVFNKNTIEHIFVNEEFDMEYQIDTEKIKQKSREYYNYINKHYPFIFPKFEQSLYSNAGILESLNLRHNSYQSYHELVIAKKHSLKQLEYNNQKYESLLKLLVEPKSFKDPLYLKHQLLLNTNNQLKNYPYVIVLGTGSMMPSTYRNVSSILYAVNENCLGLLDCGEGTYRQLCEQFGDYIENVLFKMKFILITHLHGDHVFGIYNVIAERQKVLKKLNVQSTLFIVVPENIVPTILSYVKNMEEADIVVLSTTKLMQTFRPNDEKLPKGLKIFSEKNALKMFLNYENQDLQVVMQDYYKNYLDSHKINEFLKFLETNKIKEILPVPVDHCPEACGFVVTTTNKTLVYSGDCRMTPQLAEYGRNADVLIHECTFDCSVPIEEVASKGHSNIEHAIRLAIDMNTQSLCLTHFSQRYSISSKKEWDIITLPSNDQLVEYFNKNAFLAQDHMYFDFEMINLMPELHKIFNNYTYV